MGRRACWLRLLRAYSLEASRQERKGRQAFFGLQTGLSSLSSLRLPPPPRLPLSLQLEFPLQHLVPPTIGAAFP